MNNKKKLLSKEEVKKFIKTCKEKNATLIPLQIVIDTFLIEYIKLKSLNDKLIIAHSNNNTSKVNEIINEIKNLC